jgi:hypothetical protein
VGIALDPPTAGLRNQVERTDDRRSVTPRRRWRLSTKTQVIR